MCRAPSEKKNGLQWGVRGKVLIQYLSGDSMFVNQNLQQQELGINDPLPKINEI